MDGLQALTLLPDALSLTAAIALIVASALTSAISATFGLGGGVAMLLALLMVAPPAAALPLHGIIQIGSNAGRAFMMRKFIMPALLWWFVPGALLGILLASSIFVAMPVAILQLVLSLFILWSLWAPKPRSRELSNGWFSVVGIFSSFCTMFVGATGPLLAVFLNPSRFGRDATVGTHAACMSLQHGLKVLAFGYLGFVYTHWIPVLLAMVASGLAGTYFGVKLLKCIPEDVFKKLFKVILTMLAFRLLYLAVS